MVDVPPLQREVRIESDLPCAACGYNLRTILINGRCPECGTEVAETLKSGILACSSPRWLRNIGAGCVLLLLAPAASMLALSVRGKPVQTPAQCVMVLIPGLVLLAMGLQLLTRPEPPPRVRTRSGRWTRIMLLYGGWLWLLSITGIMTAMFFLEINSLGRILKPYYFAVSGYGLIVLCVLSHYLVCLVAHGITAALRNFLRILSMTVIMLFLASPALLVFDAFAVSNRPVQQLASTLFLYGLIGLAILLVLTAFVFASARRRAMASNPPLP